MDAVVLLAAAWVGCSVVACFLVAAVVARADRPPGAPSSQPSIPLVALHAVPDEPAPPSRSSLPDAA